MTAFFKSILLKSLIRVECTGVGLAWMKEYGDGKEKAAAHSPMQTATTILPGWETTRLYTVAA